MQWYMHVSQFCNGCYHMWLGRWIHSWMRLYAMMPPIHFYVFVDILRFSHYDTGSNVKIYQNIFWHYGTNIQCTTRKFGETLNSEFLNWLMILLVVDLVIHLITGNLLDREADHPNITVIQKSVWHVICRALGSPWEETQSLCIQMHYLCRCMCKIVIYLWHAMVSGSLSLGVIVAEFSLYLARRTVFNIKHTQIER